MRVPDGPEMPHETNSTLVELDPVALVPPEPDCSPVAYSADSNNDAVVVWRRGEHPDRWLISRQREESIFSTVETAARSWSGHIFVQPLPGGEMLLASPDCEWRPSGPDRNGVVIDSSGRTIVEATIGDGVNNLLADSRGNVWAGYSDEGIYGNDGWNSPGPQTIGSSGLVRFNNRLAKAWEYEGEADDHDEAGRLPFISHCYALNVTDDTVLAYTYTSWSIIQIRAGKVNSYETDIEGASEILRSHDAYALLGGYGDQVDRFHVGTARRGRYLDTSTGEISFLRNLPIGRPTLVARGPQLNRFSSDRWWRVILQTPESRKPQSKAI